MIFPELVTMDTFWMKHRGRSTAAAAAYSGDDKVVVKSSTSALPNLMNRALAPLLWVDCLVVEIVIKSTLSRFGPQRSNSFKSLQGGTMRLLRVV